MDSVLRDLNREQGKMDTDVANLYRHFEKLRGYVRQYLEESTIEWAKLVIDHQRALLLVMETTRIVDEHGLSGYDGGNEPIRLTTLELISGEVWDQLICPSYSRSVTGTEYHGLMMADLKDQPCLADVWPEIAEVLAGRYIVIFGADWARAALQSVHPTNVLNGAACLHNRMKEFYGEFYDLSLEKILGFQGIERKREELRDSRDRILMVAEVLRNLAAGVKKKVEESDTSDPFAGLDAHPF